MTNQIGLWIDHKQAVVMTINEYGEIIQKIESGMEKHVRYRGGTHPRTPYSAQYQQGDDQLDNQFNTHLNKFYDKVVALLRGAESILILGPGEAKQELTKRLAREKSLTQAIDIQPADRMTERQIAARIRSHFQTAGASSK
jgi:stalled ribosome rescue protein Dom34